MLFCQEDLQTAGEPWRQLQEQRFHLIFPKSSECCYVTIPLVPLLKRIDGMMESGGWESEKLTDKLQLCLTLTTTLSVRQGPSRSYTEVDVMNEVSKKAAAITSSFQGLWPQGSPV